MKVGEIDAAHASASFRGRLKLPPLTRCFPDLEQVKCFAAADQGFCLLEAPE